MTFDLGFSYFSWFQAEQSTLTDLLLGGPEQEQSFQEALGRWGADGAGGLEAALWTPGSAGKTGVPGTGQRFSLHSWSAGVTLSMGNCVDQPEGGGVLWKPAAAACISSRLSSHHC